MRRSYAVWWSEGDGPRHAGKLMLSPLHALLSGNGNGRVAVPFDEIVTIDYARGELTLTRRHGEQIRIGNLDAAGALLELADSLRRAA
jgi:hypothetical protein